MDIGEFSRRYHQIEGISNTPINGVHRLLNFLKSLASLPGAVQRDSKESQRRKENRANAREDMEKNGKTWDNVRAMARNSPVRTSTHTNRAVQRVMHDANAMARQVNELGSTAKNIASGKPSASYDGQDLENGIRYCLQAYNGLSHVAHIPSSIYRNAKNIGQFGRLGVDTVMNKASSSHLDRYTEKAFGSKAAEHDNGQEER